MRYLTAIALLFGTALILTGQGVFSIAYAGERFIDPYPLSGNIIPESSLQSEPRPQAKSLEKEGNRKLRIILLPPKEEQDASRTQAAREALEAVFVPEAQDSLLPPQGATGSWEAPAGADLSETLAAWSEDAGADFVWDTQESFALQEPLHINGSYENAVQAALNQYENNALRPVARLHVDETTGERVLVVRVSGRRF